MLCFSVYPFHSMELPESQAAKEEKNESADTIIFLDDCHSDIVKQSVTHLDVRLWQAVIHHVSTC